MVRHDLLARQWQGPLFKTEKSSRHAPRLSTHRSKGRIRFIAKGGLPNRVISIESFLNWGPIDGFVNSSKNPWVRFFSLPCGIKCLVRSNFFKIYGKMMRAIGRIFHRPSPYQFQIGPLGCSSYGVKPKLKFQLKPLKAISPPEWVYFKK